MHASEQAYIKKKEWDQPVSMIEQCSFHNVLNYQVRSPIWTMHLLVKAMARILHHRASLLCKVLFIKKQVMNAFDIIHLPRVQARPMPSRVALLLIRTIRCGLSVRSQDLPLKKLFLNIISGIYKYIKTK